MKSLFFILFSLFFSMIIAITPSFGYSYTLINMTPDQVTVSIDGGPDPVITALNAPFSVGARNIPTIHRCQWQGLGSDSGRWTLNPRESKTLCLGSTGDLTQSNCGTNCIITTEITVNNERMNMIGIGNRASNFMKIGIVCRDTYKPNCAKKVIAE